MNLKNQKNEGMFILFIEHPKSSGGRQWMNVSVFTPKGLGQRSEGEGVE